MLHTKSILYHYYINQQQSNNNNNSNKQETAFRNQYNKLKMMYNKYFKTDTTGWIILSFINELTEIILQSQALYLYNGYNVFDPNNSVFYETKYAKLVFFALFLLCSSALATYFVHQYLP